MNYRINALKTDGTRICLQKDLSDDALKIIREKLNSMIVAIEHTTKCKMVQKNVRECLQCIASLSLSARADDSFLAINRTFENAVNSFYSWTQFTEVHYNKSFFSKMRQDLYDNNEDYRYTLALRICATHKVLPIKTLSFLLDKDCEVKIEVEPQFLLNYGDIPTTKAIFQELTDKQLKGEKIDIRLLLIGLDMDMPGYERMILNEIHKDLAPWIKTFTNQWTEDMNFILIVDDKGNAVTGNIIATFNEYNRSLGAFSR